MRTEASPVHYVVPGSHGDNLEDGDHRLDDVVQACRVLQDPRDCQGVLSCLKLLQSTGYLLRWLSSSKRPSPHDCCGAGSCLIFLSSIGCRYSQQQGHGRKVAFSICVTTRKRWASVRCQYNPAATRHMVHAAVRPCWTAQRRRWAAIRHGPGAAGRASGTADLAGVVGWAPACPSTAPLIRIV